MADDAGNLLQRKRVRFEDTADPEDGDDGAGQQRTRLPIKAAPQELAIEDFSAEEGPIKALDPALAATRRARYRAESVRLSLLEDTSIPDDVAAAEEDYEEPEELYNEQGIPIEPFHLRREREEGYFDADGNYIEYRLDHLRDAWLDSLEEDPAAGRAADPNAPEQLLSGLGTGPGPSSTSILRRMLGAGSSSSSLVQEAVQSLEGEEAQDEEPQLDEEDLAVFRRRAAELLLPGETVLQGIKRLGVGLKRHSVTAQSTEARQQARKQQRAARAAAQQQQLPSGPAEPATATSVGNPSTSGGVSVSVSAAGAGTGTAGATLAMGAGAKGAVPSPAKQAATGPMLPERATGGSHSAGGSAMDIDSGAGAEGGASHRGLVTSPARPGSGGSLQAAADDTSIPFEKLTALADQLLAHGDFDIYSTTREVLLRQAQAALGVEAARQAAAQATRRTPGLHGAVTTTTSLAAAARPAAAAAAGPAADAAGQGLAPAGAEGDVTWAAEAEALDSDTDMFAEEDSSTEHPAPAGDVTHGSVAGPTGQGVIPASTQGSQPPADPSALLAQTPAAGDVLGGAEAVHGQSGAGVDASGSSTSVLDTACAGAGAGASPATQADSPSAAVLSVAAPAIDGSTGLDSAAATDGKDGAVGSSGSGVVADGEAAEAALEQVLSGFALDESSGYLYNSSLGYYYDVSTSLFGDASTGTWYKYKNGQYVAVQ